MADVDVIMTRSQFEQARTKIAAKGVTLVGDAGEVTEAGVTLDFTFVEPKLSINILKCSYPKFMVEHSIKGWFHDNA
jgi:hypothetical protein